MTYWLHLSSTGPSKTLQQNSPPTNDEEDKLDSKMKSKGEEQRIMSYKPAVRKEIKNSSSKSEGWV